MPEVTIKYKHSKTLEALKDLAKYFDFVISEPKKPVIKQGVINVNGVKMLRGAGAVKDAEMNEVFTRNKFSSKDLRSKWQRTK